MDNLEAKEHITESTLTTGAELDAFTIVSAERTPDGGIGYSTLVEGLGILSVTENIYCTYDEFDVFVSVDASGVDNAPDTVLRPHGGPDPESDEYTEIGFRYLELDENGQAEVALYSLPSIAHYELVDPSNLLDNPIATIAPSSGAFDAFCFEDVGTAPEFDDDEQSDETELDTPDVEVDDTTAPDDDLENSETEDEEATEDSVETVQPTDDLFQGSETESQATTVESQSQDFNAELPETGSDLVLTVALGAAAVALGITKIKAARYLDRK